MANQTRSGQYIYEREDTQKKTFLKWINYIMRKGNRKIEVKDIVIDLQDGSILLALLEVITGKKLRQEKGRMRVHKINNINRVLEVLQKYDTKLVNIRSEEIVDGNTKLILGLIWSIIMHFQVKGAMHHSTSGTKTNSELESSILNWCRQCTQRYKEVDIRNFTSSWRDGLAFNAILHHHRPDLFDYNKLLGRPPNANLSQAFEKARTHFGIAPLLDPEDVNIDHPDKKSIMVYVTTMYEVLSKLKETESDPGSEIEQAARSDSPTPSSVSTMSEWDDYNETLTQVSTWLLQAETQLKQQEPVSANVDQVKEQFREHEEFMMILTSHQTSVGSVLEFGSQLINEGIVVGKEEKDIREQMAVLSERWENLRVSAMHRQSELHQHLMKLQQQQLKELDDWLTKAEYKMKTAGAIGSDLDTVKKQVEEHKHFQEDLENQQQHVNSLSHMVVVVDESESENATADLEEQLASLGERWSAVCKWTEHRWAHLQEILTSWQQYRDEEQRLSKWLHEKERALKDISVIDMGDKNEVEKQLQKLKDLEEELTLQQNSFGDFNLAAQRVAQTLEEDSPAIASIQDTMEDFNQRWNLIASMLNAKTKHFKGMEDQLQTFLRELEENISWLNDTEMLLKPQANPERKLVESLDQAMKKRRTSIIELTRQGEELLKQSASAGQSVAGLKQYINSFNDRWESVTHILDNQKNALSFSERKKAFVDETQRILIMITEITTYVENIFIDMKNNPKEMLIKIEIKQKELSLCEEALEKLWLDCGKVSDPALKSAFEAEYKDVSSKVKTVESLIQEKHKAAVEAVQSTPPAEFSDKTKLVQAVIDETFPFVSKDFKYDEIKNMTELADVLKEKLDNLNTHEVHLKTLSKQQKEMLKALSTDKAQKYQKLLADLTRQWNNCKKVTEARLQRVNEAVTQTKELEVAMRETFNWMDDVDKFLEEITGTIAEGDAETIDSQVQEVEALQEDIATVQKKVDSLIETCSLIIDRAQPNYAETMKTKLTSLQQRWGVIISTTDKQKENLKNAGLKFQEVDNGVKEIIEFLKGLQITIQNDTFNKLDKITLEAKIHEYEDMEKTVTSKGNTITEFTNIVTHLISTAPSDMETPPVYKELQSSSSMVSSVSLSINGILQRLKTAQKQFDEFEGLIRKTYHAMELLDAAISKSSEKLDGDDEELKNCLGVLDELLRKFSGEDVKQIDELGNLLISSDVCVTKTKDMIGEYKARLDDTKERCKKVQYILEGELMKRQQLRKDLVQIGEWLDRMEKDTSDKIKENADISDEYIDNLKEEISLNEALVSSAERSVKELINTGRPENHKDLISKLEGIQSRWGGLLKAYEVVKSKPKQKELENKFFALEGSILSDIDNLRRKIKKVKMTSPEVLDIQQAVETLEDLSKSSDSVHVDIQTLTQYAESLTKKDSSKIDQQIKEIQNEYNGVKDLLKSKEKVLADALPLSESVFANLETFDNWLKVVNENLQNISVKPLPATPEESIIKVDNILKEITEKAVDIQQLCSNAGNLGQMSEEPAFQAMETRVHDIREVYGEIKRDAQDRKDTFQSWRKQLDEYEKKVDDLNAWIDSRFSTLESIGGLSARLDVEMELDKLKKLIFLINSKESELDNLKSLGDDIAMKGHQSIVDPYEKQVYQRWDELEKKYKSVQSLLEMKLKEVSYQPPKKTAKIISEEEVIVDEPINILEVESAPPSFLDSSDIDIVPQVAAPVESTPIISTRAPTKKYKRETKASLQQSVEDMILEIEAIEASLPNLRTDSENGLKTIQTNVEIIEDHLGELQPDFENIIEEAKDTLQELNNNDSNREPILRLSKKFSDVHADLMIRRQSLQDADFKFSHMKSYLSDCQMWLAGAEKLLQSEKQLENLKEIETSIEQYSARLESVNIRAEQLVDVCSETLIPKKQISLVNKRFHMVAHHFEKYQQPEEKVTSYRVSVETGDRPDAETKANVYIKLFGEYGNSDQLQLRQSETKRKKFQSGQVDLFTFRNQPWLGKLSKIRVWHDNEGLNPAWFLASIYVLDELSGRLFCFVIDTWLSKENGAVLKEMPVSAVALSQEASPDIMVKRHMISDVHWLFDTFSSQPSEPDLKPREELIEDIKKEIRTIEEIENRLSHPCFTGKPFDDFSRQEEILQDVEAQITKTNHAVTHFMMIRERYLAECTQEEMYDIDVNLTGMRSRWNAVNKEFKGRYVAYERNVELWKQFHDDLNTLTIFLSGVENQLSNNELSETEIKEIQNEIYLHQERLNGLNRIASDIILQSSENNGKELQNKLDTVNSKWNKITGEITNRKMKDLIDDHEIKKFMNGCSALQQALDKLRTTLSYQKPHPIDAEELRNCLGELQNYDDEVSELQKTMHNLNNDAKKILSRSDLSPTQLDEIKSRSNSLDKYYQEITLSFENQKSSLHDKISRAVKFLDELAELSAWMSRTRTLLEGNNEGRPGCQVDPEMIKSSLETRKSNVESINKLLKEFKAEGELTSGQFPQDVGEKIARLNTDWQVIIRLAVALKDRPISEEMVVAEAMQQAESSVPIFENDTTDSASSTNTLDKNSAQLHDWLKLVENKLKGLSVVVGDDEDMESALKKLAIIQVDLENRKNDLEDVIEMAAAMNMESTDESLNYAVDDKISKLKEHWELVSDKVFAQKDPLENVISDWRRYSELRLQLDNFIYKAELQLDDAQKIGTTATEIEEQLEKHKIFRQELIVWASTYDNLVRVAEHLSISYAKHDLTEFQNTFNLIKTRWTNLEQRSNARQQSLQEALDRLLLFHQNMISAMTWLSSAESKVAELDSLVEASQAEDSGDMDELQREMVKLEDDISAHQSMFQGLNETGQQIMMDLEAGEVRLALQSKLDDMNDRWNSLGVRVVDIRERMSDGTGEWRQLLLDMQEIVDWLSRADQDLMSQQPLGSSIEVIQQQSEKHQEFKEKLTKRRLVIEHALEQGHDFLLKHQAQSLDINYLARNDSNLVQRVASNLQSQLAHIDSQWQELRQNSDKWQRSLDVVLELTNQLLQDIDSVNRKLDEAERLRNTWMLTSEIVVDNIHVHLDEVKDLRQRVVEMEPSIDRMSDTAKEIRVVHGVSLSAPTETSIEQCQNRWKQLYDDCQLRHQNLQNLAGDVDESEGVVPLEGSVSPPWERGQALNKVPYFINHDTKTTTWDHPKMTDLYQTLSELNDVKFAAYRTSMKLRCIQKACCLDLVDLKPAVTDGFDKHGIRSNNDSLIDVGEMIKVLLTIFENVEKSRKDAIHVPQSVDMTLNWLLNVYDSGRIGKLRILSFKIGIVLLSRAKLEDKWRYLFRQIADETGHVDSKKLGLLLHDCVQIPRQLGEIAAFGGSNIEPSVRSCFDKVKNPQFIEASNFIDWTAAEPQSLVWMPVLHRLAAAETARHDAKCQICKEYPIIGFRYRCLKCFSYDLCQNCFWAGRISKSHRVTHPMHQYSLATTTGEDMSDFVKLMKNKFKSRRYRSRPPKKLGYLPVQTIMEGSSIETPSLPTTPDMSFTFPSMNGAASSPETSHRDMNGLNEEHRLIQQMCRSLNGDVGTTLSTTGGIPQSPSQILASLDDVQRKDIDEIIRGLQDEHQSLQEEYNRLQDIRGGRMENGGQVNGIETARDTELLAEAKNLREHKGKLEARMQILEDHNRQLEAQLQKLRQLLEQPTTERQNSNVSIHSPPSPSRVTPALTPSSSYHGSPEFSKNRKMIDSPGYSSDSASEFRHVTNQIENAFPME